MTCSKVTGHVIRIHESTLELEATWFGLDKLAFDSRQVKGWQLELYGALALLHCRLCKDVLIGKGWASPQLERVNQASAICHSLFRL